MRYLIAGLVLLGAFVAAPAEADTVTTVVSFTVESGSLFLGDDGVVQDLRRVNQQPVVSISANGAVRTTSVF